MSELTNTLTYNEATQLEPWNPGGSIITVGPILHRIGIHPDRRVRVHQPDRRSALTVF